VVDEATLLRPWELSFVVGKSTKEIYLLGDPIQISVIDMFSSGGVRLTYNALTSASKYNKLTKLTSSYRYGNPLVEELAKCPALNDLNTLASHETNYENHWLQKWDGPSLNDLTLKTNVILVFYQDQIKQAKTIIASTGSRRAINVQTVHAYQGLESDDVTVIQSPLGKTHTADVHLQLGHCVSAATRAIKNLRWISIGCFNSTTTLHEKLGSDIGGKIDCEEAVQHKYDNEPIETLQSVPEDRRKRIDAAKFINLVGEHTNLVKVSVSYEDNKSIITLNTPFQVGKVIYSNGNIQIENVPDRFKPNIESAVLSCLTDDELDLVEHCVIAKEKAYRVRNVSHYVKVCKASSLESNMNGILKDFTVFTKKSQCAACCGLEFHLNNSVTTIHEDYFLPGARAVEGPYSELVSEVFNTNLFESVFDNRLDDLEMSHVILSERFATAVHDLLERSVSFQRVMWHNKYDNLIVQTKVHNQLNMLPKINGYDNMEWYPYFSTSLGGLATTVSYIEVGKRIKITRRNVDPVQYVILGIAELKRNLGPQQLAKLTAKKYMEKVGSKDRLEGMAEGFDWHKSRKTQVFANLVDRLGKIDVSALKGKRNVVYCPREVAKMCQDKYPDYKVGDNNFNVVTDAGSAAADVIFSMSVTDEHPHERILLNLRTSYCAYSMGTDNTYQSNLTNCINIEMNKKMEFGMYKQMLERHASKLGAENEMYSKLILEVADGGKWSHNTNNDYDVLATNLEIVQDNENLIVDILKKNKRVYVWWPNRVNYSQNITHRSVEGSKMTFIVKESWEKSS